MLSVVEDAKSSVAANFPSVLQRELSVEIPAFFNLDGVLETFPRKTL